MAENELLEHRVCKLEKDVENLYSKTNRAEIALAETSVNLGNILTAIGELKGIVSMLSSRPGKWWDKLIAGIIGAIASGCVAVVINTIIK